jgi:4-alpha-glucanotransferase
MLSDAQYLLETIAGSEWKSIGPRHHHGIDIPLFSLHSAHSCGIGEFFDLIPLLDWCQKLGFDVIQLLPLNDTGDQTSPYSAISALALNPLHLSLSRLPHVEMVPDLESKLQKLRTFTLLQRIDYPNLLRCRNQFLNDYFKCVGALIANSSDYLLFLNQYSWITPYALFKSIKIKRDWQSWQEWPHNMAQPSETEYALLLEEYSTEITFHSCIQYLCFQQLQEVKKIADQKRIFLKGDIPILINFESADVWHCRDFFLLDYSAGAPPDMYAKEGQKWGFPIYNWDSLAKDNYQWWKIRLKTTEHFYHIYRLDHIVGFFRIWSIPRELPASEGFYLPEDLETWIPQGEKILKVLLSSCLMLPIGEDLGTVPPEVRTSLKALGICSTKVMRWERNWETDRSYIDPKDYPLVSMTTVSTHDSETLQLWWKNQIEEAQDFSTFKGWTYDPVLTPEHHLEILYDSHHSRSLFHINLLNEYLALVPEMTWPNLEDERINIPGVVSDDNWTYRFRSSVEKIIANETLQQLIKKATGLPGWSG